MRPGACLHSPEEDLETGHEGFKVIVSVVLCVGVVSHVSEHLRVFCRYNICQNLDVSAASVPFFVLVISDHQCQNYHVCDNESC